MSVLSIAEYTADSIPLRQNRTRVCPHCDYPVDKPYRRYSEKGKVIAGCIHPCHDRHIEAGEQMRSIKIARLGIANHIIEVSHTRDEVHDGSFASYNFLAQDKSN